MKLFLISRMLHSFSICTSVAEKEWTYCLIPSAHGPFFCLRQKIGVKIGSCALTFGPIENRSNFFSELLTTKNRSVCADFSPTINRSPTMGSRLPLSSAMTLIKRLSGPQTSFGRGFSRSDLTCC